VSWEGPLEKPLCVRLDAITQRELELRARDEDVSIAELIRRVIYLWLAYEGRRF
jgi:hypothetical protein